MHRLLVFLYGLGAYLAALTTLLYLVGFGANVLVPRSVDVGPGGPWTVAVAVDVLLLAAFGVQHSVMARRSFKSWWVHIVPASLERSTYVLATCAMLGLLFVLWRPIESPILWKLERPFLVALVWGLFAAGWLLALASTFLLSHCELFGLRQVTAYLTHSAIPQAVFRTPNLYRHVRHPLYLGLLISLWAAPVMTIGRALFACGLSTYILIGIAFEERDLLRQFGARYGDYRARVGMLIPTLLID